MEWPRQDNLRNPRKDREPENWRRRRRDDMGEKHKYQDNLSDGNYREMSLREDRPSLKKLKGERSGGDQYRNDGYRDMYREDVNMDYRNREDKLRGVRSSKDHRSETPAPKHFRDENKVKENQQKRPPNSDCDESTHIDGRFTRYKGDKDRKWSSKDEEGHSDLTSMNTPVRRSEVEKKAESTGKVASHALQRMPQSRDGSTIKSSEWKTSSADASNDRRRSTPRQSFDKMEGGKGGSEDAKKNSAIEDRRSRCLPSEKSAEKSSSRVHKMEGGIGGSEDAKNNSAIEDRRSRYLPLEKSTEKNSSRDEKMEGGKGGSEDAKKNSAVEDRRSRYLPSEKLAEENSSRAEGEIPSVSSGYCRMTHLPENSCFLPPPAPLRPGVASSSVSEDVRGKSINRARKYAADANAVRGLGNDGGKGILASPSPVASGFIHFPYRPPPRGFHPAMQQFSAYPGGLNPYLDLNYTGYPYRHIPCPDNYSTYGPYGYNLADEAYLSHLHGWQGNNELLGYDPRMDGTQYWNQNRHFMSSHGWEASREMWQGQNAGEQVQLPLTTQKDDNLQQIPLDDTRSGQPSQQLRTDCGRPRSVQESIEVVKSSEAPLAEDSTEAPSRTGKEANYVCPSSHAYLFNLDISKDLTRPELYDHCKNLPAHEHSSVEKVVKHDYIEERTEAGVKFSNIPAGVSLFPTIKETLCERAISLYKKESNKTIFKKYTPSFPKPKQDKFPTNEEKKLEPVATTDEPGPSSAVDSESSFIEKKLEPVPKSDDHMPEPSSAMDFESLHNEKKPERVLTTHEHLPEPTAAMDSESFYPLSVSDQDKIIKQVLASSEENLESLSNAEQELVEEFPLSNLKVIEETFTALVEDKAEVETSTFSQNLEELIEVPVEKNEIEKDTPIEDEGEAAMKVAYYSSDPTPGQDKVEVLQNMEVVVEDLPELSSSIDCKNSYPDSASSQENMIEQIATSSERKVDEPLSNSDEVMVVVVLASDEVKTDVETSTVVQNLEKLVPVSVAKEADKELDSTLVEDKIEPIVENMKAVVEYYCRDPTRVHQVEEVLKNSKDVVEDVLDQSSPMDCENSYHDSAAYQDNMIERVAASNQEKLDELVSNADQEILVAVTVSDEVKTDVETSTSVQNFKELVPVCVAKEADKEQDSTVVEDKIEPILENMKEVVEYYCTDPTRVEKVLKNMEDVVDDLPYCSSDPPRVQDEEENVLKNMRDQDLVGDLPYYSSTRVKDELEKVLKNMEDQDVVEALPHYSLDPTRVQDQLQKVLKNMEGVVEGSPDPSSSSKKSDPDSGSDQDNVIEQIAASSEEKVDKPLFNSDQEMVVVVPVSDEVKTDLGTSTFNLEELVPIPVTKKETEKEPHSTLIEDKTEPILENVKEVVYYSPDPTGVLDQVAQVLKDVECVVEDLPDQSSSMDCEHSYYDLPAYQDNMIEQIAVSSEEKFNERLSNSDQEMILAVVSDEVKTDVETSNFVQNLVELDPVPVAEEEEQEPDSTLIQDKKEPVRENVKEVIKYHSSDSKSGQDKVEPVLKIIEELIVHHSPDSTFIQGNEDPVLKSTENVVEYHSSPPEQASSPPEQASSPAKDLPSTEEDTSSGDYSEIIHFTGKSKDN